MEYPGGLDGSGQLLGLGDLFLQTALIPIESCFDIE
jgi:hypothetical protein